MLIDEAESVAYAWLAERFGENAACALIPDAWVDPTPADTIAEARAHFAAWLAHTSTDAATTALED